MDLKQEIHNAINEISLKKKSKNINKDKLCALFDMSEPDVPERVMMFPLRPSYNVLPEKTENSFLYLLKFFLRKVVMVPLGILVLAVGVYVSHSVFFQVKAGGIVAAISGKVILQREGKHIGIKAGGNIYQGDILITDSEASVDLVFRDSIFVRVDGGSKTEIQRLAFSGDKQAQFFLQEGSLHLFAKKLFKNEDVSIKTNNSIANVKGTFFSVQYQNHMTRYEVFEGKIKVRNTVNYKKMTLDKAHVKLLENHFEDFSQIVPGNSVCFVPDNRKLYEDMNSGNFDKRLKQIALPDVAELTKKNSQLAVKAEKMIEAPSSTGIPLGISVVYIDVKPKTANVIIDDSKVVENNSKVFLKKGVHTIEARARGYRKKIIQYKVDKTFKQLSLVLEIPPKEYFDIIPSQIDATYVYYVDDKQLLIMLNAQGMITATDLNVVRWELNLGEELFLNATSDSDHLYVASKSGKLYSINVLQGIVRWKMKLYGEINDLQQVLFDRRNIYFITSKNLLYKLTKYGTILWRTKLDFKTKLKPFIAKKSIFIAGNNKTLYRFDKGNGTMLLQYRLGEKIISMTGDYDKVYVLRANGVISSVSTLTGDIVWNYVLPKKNDVYSMKIFADENSLYAVARHGYILKLSKNGMALWEYRDQNRSFILPIIDHKRVYIADKHALFVLDKNKGSVIWSLVVPRLVSKNISVSSDRMFFITENKGLVVLKKQ